MIKNRTLLTLKYLWEKTDEEHPITTTEILHILSESGITTTRKTVADDITELQKLGLDVVRNRRQQNEYFVRSRVLEPVELKIVIDALQAAKFLSHQKSDELVEKLTCLSSYYQKDVFKQSLRLKSVKTYNNKVYYIVDILLSAIMKKQVVSFQYMDYSAEGKRTLKHDGHIYIVSPYDLVWSGDSYYVFGWSETYGKVVKFRIDRMCNQEIADGEFHFPPDDYDISSLCRSLFAMHDGETCIVEMKCENDTMVSVLDRFGDKVQIVRIGETHYDAVAAVSVSSSFFTWIVSFGGRIELLSPEKVKSDLVIFLKKIIQSHRN